MKRAATWASGLIGLVLSPAAPAAEADAEFFEKHVRPVLVENCFSCHGPKRQQAGLRLDSRAAALKGNDAGPVLVPGEPDKSRLIHAVRYDGDPKMPPKGKLPAEAVEALTVWVKSGAVWPESPAAEPRPAGPPSVAEARQNHWAFQPVKQPALPAVGNAAWATSPLDLFVLARLEEKGLAPSAPADRRTLLRRATLDLIGLPPTPDEVAAFEADPSPDAFAKVVERLLASPHYGERWGRHWLDVARYADTKGYAFREERRYPYSYTYRDYVIRAFNEDLPYDQFVVQQLAADRLLGVGHVSNVPGSERHVGNVPHDQRALAAMGFLTLGRRFLNNTHDIIDDRIDVVSRGLLGLTVSCARCHDHKFDPIPTTDYYSLYGVFASSVEPRDLPVITEPEPSPAYLAYQKVLKELQEAVDKFEAQHRDELMSGNRKFRDELRTLQRKVDQHKVTHPGSPPQAMVLVDAQQPVQPHVFVRGNPNNHGPAVPRQFLEVLAGVGAQPFRDGSGRLELARAIASSDNPLTARVLVNRVWLHHFGQGLVRTPSNFGLRGEPPTHPELLDYLATTFMENGWSIKHLHRLILLSSTYQQASADNPAGWQVDPDNRLLWRMNRRRLEFEALRDSLLAVAGRLDTRAGGVPVDLLTTPFTTRRTVYGFIDRQNLPGVFRTFDLASPDSSSPQRYNTTVPQQALYLMNSPFVAEQARHLAKRVEGSPEERIQRLYRLVYGRAADAAEVALGADFVKAAGTEGALTGWEKYAQVLLLANEFVFVD
jgi:cytochrome c553